MSLTLALDQIQRPTWWTLESRQPRATPPLLEEKYQQVMNCLLGATKPVNCAYIEDYTGYTTQSIRHLTKRLIEEGKVKKLVVDKAVTFQAVRHA